MKSKYNLWIGKFFWVVEMVNSGYDVFMEYGNEVIVLEGVRKKFLMPGGHGEVQILRGIDAVIRNGERVAIVGPSGCGKSTLLNVIGGLEDVDAGRVLIQGRDIHGLKASELSAYRNKTVGFIFQNHHLLPQCSVLENAIVPVLAFQSRVAPAQLDRARTLLDRVGLKDRVTYRPRELSGGERQRVALVRALIMQPVFILADEPTGALDPVTAESMADLLLEMNQSEQLTLVLVTHSLGLAGRMDRVLSFSDGMLVESSASVSGS